MRETVVSALREAGVHPKDAVLVACSHGPDSLALADAVLGVRRLLRLGEVTLVYVDHGLRPAARDEAESVRELAEAAGARARVEVVRVAREGRGLEDAARVARYAALERAAREVGARFILLGHTASDQAETVLLRLLRGAGPVGLAGIPPVRGPYVRPLLSLSRAAIDAYLAARGLAPSRDASNEDLAFARNRVRHQILPALRQENPSAETTLARTAAALRELADALAWAAARARAEIVREETSHAVHLDAGGLAALPPAVAKRLLLDVAAALGVSLEARHLEAMLALVASDSTPRRARRLDGPRLAVGLERDPEGKLRLSLTKLDVPAINEGCSAVVSRDGRELT